MYIQQVRLQNIICFEDITLDFTQQESDTPAQWVVLLGENGTGKSTILQLIGLTMLGRDMALHIARDMIWERFVHSSQEIGKVSAIFSMTHHDTEPHEQAPRYNKGACSSYHVAFEIGKNIKASVREIRQEDSTDFALLDETLYSEQLPIGWFACGYGVWRRLPSLSGTPLTPARMRTHKKSYRFVTLFSYHIDLVDVVEWLTGLEFQRIKALEDAVETTTASRHFTLAIKSLERILESITFKRITPEGEVILEENGAEVSIHRLSDGNQSITVLILDLIRRLIDAFPDMPNPLEASGVVLIDEIDIHLHPKWQRRVVEQFRALFPNLQFIVSSHSPFVAQDMLPEDKLIVLKKRGDRVVEEEEQGFVEGWRVDQIFTSSLFGMETTRNERIARIEKEYQTLQQQHVAGKLSEKDTQRLYELKHWLDQHRSSPGETVDENALYETAKSFLDVLHTYQTK